MPLKAFLTLLFAFALCAPAAAQDKLRVVATTGILADMAAQVGGDAVVASAIIPPNADQHSFSPTPADVRAVSRADLVIVNGLGLEAGWLDKLIANSGYQGPIVVAALGIEPLDDPGHAHGEHSTHQHGEVDPHAWMDVSNAIAYVRNIQQGLEQLDPAHKADYAAYAELYAAQLRVLDSWIKREVTRIPPDRRVIVTGHDAFRYFGAAYGFRTYSLMGVSNLTEPAAREFADLARTLHDHSSHDHDHADAPPAGSFIFVETAANEKLLARLAAEAGIASDTPIAGHLSVDGWIEADGCRRSYIDMMRINVRTILRAQGPARP